MKEKFKSYSFWMSVSAGVVLVINNIGKVFGFSISNEVVTEIVDSICGVLILFGVISMNTKNENSDEENATGNVENATKSTAQKSVKENENIEKTAKKQQKNHKITQKPVHNTMKNTDNYETVDIENNTKV